MESASSDPYSPPIASDAIRLFQLTTGEDGAIAAELRRFALDPEACPPFVATSYVWGEPTYSNTIMINGRPTPILKSAHELFRAMQGPAFRHEFPETTWWWMDSICINQSDNDERSAQVELMSTIYKKAHRTLVWLGDASEDSDRAVDFLHLLTEQSPRDHSQRGPKTIADDDEGWKAVSSLLQREWWERVWTLQEFLMGTHVVFFCGQRHISRRRMLLAVNKVWDWRELKRDVYSRESYEKAWNRFRIFQWYFGRRDMPLVGMMAYTATFRVTDPRDRLYSLLGLASSKDNAVVGHPDYQSDVGSVYLRFAKSFIEQHQSLDIICVAAELKKDVMDPGAKDYNLGLPSWVPDWSLRRKYSPPVLCMASQSSGKHIGNFRPLHSEDWSCSFAASGRWRPRVSFSPDLRELTCAGVLLDQIDGLGGVKQVRHETEELCQSTSDINIAQPPGKGKISKGKKCATLLESVSRCLVLDRRDRYFSHPAPREDFELEFIVLCDAVLAKPEDVHPRFREWFQLNKDLQIHGVTLEDAARGMATWYEKLLRSLKITSFQKKYDYDISHASDWESFVSRSRDTTSTEGKRLMVTNAGLLGMAPRDAKKGDIVCVLLGCNIPMVLRQVPDREAFQVVGECFLDGYMDGEVLVDIREERRSIRDFGLV